MTDDSDCDFDDEELDEQPGGAARLWYPLCDFALDWWYSRNWKSLLFSLPGVVLAGLLLVLLVLGSQAPVEKRVDRYQAVAQTALARGDGAAAEVYFRRLAALQDVSPPTRYGLALAAALQGDEARARSLMQSLAPEHAGGYAEAHLWLAKDLLSQQSQLTLPAATVIEHHLRQVLASSQNNEEAASLLGVVLWSRGDAQSALPFLEQTAQRSPEWQLPLAVLYESRGDSAAARNAAKRAAAHFRKAAEADPRAVEARVSWARSEALMKNFPEAVRILQAGLRREDPQPFHQALVGVYLAWTVLTPAETPEGLATRLELLNQALIHGPNHPQVLTLLADLSVQDGVGTDTSRAALQEALASGTAPATVHLVLGTQALQQGDLERAQTHLELACERAPDMPIVLNNLAWVLAHREPPELDRAGQLALAAKKLSDDPEISDTLGTILARQGKYRAAITELETVLRAFPKRPKVHRQLAELYDKLGNAELAEAYRRRAQAADGDGDK
jgi:tetratricopeptide (TPR) repeat protein